MSASAPFIVLAGIVISQSHEYKKAAQKLNRADYLAQEQAQARQIDWQRSSPNLGFSNLKANWSYLDYVQYFGDRNARETIGYKLVPEYFAAIAGIDPRFVEAHLRLSIGNSMYAGDPETTIALMEQVLAVVDPESNNASYLWTSKGLDELLFIGDKEAAIESYEMAAKWANLTQDERSNRTAVEELETIFFDSTELDLKQAQVRAWSSVLVHIRDSQRQREILDKIIDLKAEIAALEQKNIVQ